MTLDGQRVTYGELARQWGIAPSRIRTSYVRHSPVTRDALREWIQHDLVHALSKGPHRRGTLIWGHKGNVTKGVGKSLNCEGLRAVLVSRGVRLPELPGIVIVKTAG